MEQQRGTFSHYKHDPDSLSGNLVWTIYEDREGMLWVGTFSGLDRFDRTTQTVTHYPTYNASESDDLAGGRSFIQFMHEDQAGDLWVLMVNGRIDKRSRTSGTFTQYRHDPNDPRSLSHDVVSVTWALQPAFLEDQQGIVWIGTRGGGLNRYDRTTDSFTHYRYDPDDAFSLSNDTVSVITESRDGVLWVGTHAGLNRLDRETGTFTRFPADPDATPGLSYPTMTFLFEDREGAFWIGTKQSGLHRFDR